jgi:LmbE family N-acetylglucosaminyl deacetylase
MKRLSLCLILLLCVSASQRLNGQVRPVNDYGALGLGQLLRKLQTTGSVMMIGAHPDDEDSALLAYLARGESARTAYLSLTRGDGGQNIIGPELFESLGVIRTEELLQARRLDGAEQYFTRAFDYGFSKTLAEAKSKWPEDLIKCDVVRAIRLFRPLVVISRFTGTPQDGHGQHQYAGYITPIAVKAAGEPSQCVEAGEPWTPKKFYVEQGFQDNEEPTLKINTGQYDALLGRTYFEIAMEGRSLHRSQGEGRIEFHGDQFSGLNLVGAVKEIREKSIFDGIDVSVSGIPRLTANDQEIFRGKVDKLAEDVDELLRTANLSRPTETLATFTKIYKAAYDAEWSTRYPESKFRLREVEAKAVAGIRLAAGIQIDALCPIETVAPGDELMVSVKAFRATASAEVGEISVTAPSGWTVSGTEAPKVSNAAFNPREKAAAVMVFNVKVPTDSDSTGPYWLRSNRKGDLFAWPASAAATLPFEPPIITAHVKLNISGTEVTLDQPVQYRFADPARGEVRRELNVVPAVSVAIDRDLLIAPISPRPQTKRVVVTVTNNTDREQSGHVTLNIGASPDVKVATPQGQEFSLKTRGAKASVPFDITIPRTTVPVDIDVYASAVAGSATYRLTMNTISYPHIQTHRYYTPADSIMRILDLKASPLSIGYVMGSGDEVPEAIRQMGMKVTMLAENDLASGDLSKFDTIVVGIRASETRPDLVANNQRLLEYARAGGNVVVQYQRFNWTGIAPFPVNTQDKQGTTAGSIARVVDENAPVKILDPADPIFTTPNKITEADFGGWVQERNAYNLVTFDPQYKPLLESHDAAEQENNGGLVRARLGKGSWTYCSYSFFRQLPAGVPGAYRLFANLLSLARGR